MTVTAAIMRNVGWNTAVTFGVALTSGTLAWGVSKAVHSFFGVRQDIKKTSSFLIQSASLTTGVAAGFYTFQNATVVHLPLDSSFVRAHGFSVIMGLYTLIIGSIIASRDNAKPATLYASVGILTLATPFIAHYGQNALIPAIGIGAAVGSYL